MPESNTNIEVEVSIRRGQPPYQVTLNPPGPYRMSHPDSTITAKLDQQSARSGFQMFGIGFREPESEDQLTARVTTTDTVNDTLVITDAKTKNGTFEFALLYQDANRGDTVYGLDPEVINVDP